MEEMFIWLWFMVFFSILSLAFGDWVWFFLW